MGKRSLLVNKIKFPKNCESAGILRVLFGQILCENLINVVKGIIFMNLFAEVSVLSADIHSENGNWNQENLKHNQINVVIL